MDWYRLTHPFGEINDKDTQFTASIKSNQEIVLIVGFLVIFGVIYGLFSVFSDNRPTGTWRYGLCKVFLERYAQFPESLKILTAAEKQNSAQIGYLITNSYGSRESQLMECFYNTNGNTVKMSRVTIDRKTYDEDIVADFNVTLNVIMASDDLDLKLPRRLPNTLSDLKFE